MNINELFCKKKCINSFFFSLKTKNDYSINVSVFVCIYETLCILFCIVLLCAVILDTYCVDTYMQYAVHALRCYISYHTVLYRITSYHIILYHVQSYRCLLQRIISNCNILYRVVSTRPTRWRRLCVHLIPSSIVFLPSRLTLKCTTS